LFSWLTDFTTFTLVRLVGGMSLTAREYARMQSVPDWLGFEGKNTTGGARRTRECPRYTPIGNAVAPLVAQGLGNAVVWLSRVHEGMASCECAHEAARNFAHG
jgi:DNA (cytosine-5)-methyltransferase 1